MKYFTFLLVATTYSASLIAGGFFVETLVEYSIISSEPSLEDSSDASSEASSDASSDLSDYSSLRRYINDPEVIEEAMAFLAHDGKIEVSKKLKKAMQLIKEKYPILSSEIGYANKLIVLSKK